MRRKIFPAWLWLGYANIHRMGTVFPPGRMKAAALCEGRERKGDDALSEQESTLTSHLTAAPITPAAESPFPQEKQKKRI